MNGLARYAIRLALPVVAEAVLALVHALEAQGLTPADAASEATAIVAIVERDHPDWAEATRRSHALRQIGAALRRRSGQEPTRATVEGLYGLALQHIRHPADRQSAQSPAR